MATSTQAQPDDTVPNISTIFSGGLMPGAGPSWRVRPTAPPHARATQHGDTVVSVTKQCAELVADAAGQRNVADLVSPGGDVPDWSRNFCAEFSHAKVGYCPPWIDRRILRPQTASKSTLTDSLCVPPPSSTPRTGLTSP